MTPTIPTTNNLWILSLVSGIILLFFGISGTNDQINYTQENSKKLKKLYYEREQISKLLPDVKNNQDSISEIIKNHSKNAELIEVVKELNRQNTIALKKYKTESEDLDKKIDILNLEFEIESEIYEGNEVENTVIYFIGLILFIIGIIQLMKNQGYRDKLLFSEFMKLKVKHRECQSCAMELEADKNFDGNSNYCSYCFDGRNFSHQNIDLESFKELVKDQLVIKGFSKRKIKRHLSKLNTLLRWKKKFDWE
jgi:hypothetical protein